MSGLQGARSRLLYQMVPGKCFKDPDSFIEKNNSFLRGYSALA